MAASVPTGAGNVTTGLKTTSGTDFTVPIPANTAVGDVLVATFSSDYNGGVTVATPGWTRVSPGKNGSMRELAVFHAFTADGIPDAPVFTQSGAAASRAAVAIYRVVGASQTERTVGTSAYAATADTANTAGMTIPSTGAPANSGVTIAVAYNNSNASQSGQAGNPTFNGEAPATYLVAYGTGGPGSSTTPQAIHWGTSPGPFTLSWGKTVANSMGVAVTIPHDGTAGPVEPPEEEHDDEPGVTIQQGLNNVTKAAVNAPGVPATLFVPLPSRARQGDVLLTVVTHSGNASVSIDAAWTLLSTVRTGSNRWMSAYGYPVREQPPYPGVTLNTSEVGARMSAVMVRLTGVGYDDYLRMAGSWQLTEAGDNRTAYSIEPTTGATTVGNITLVAAYTNVSAGQAPALTTVANGVLLGHSYAETAGQATTALSVWRHHSGVRKDVTISPAAANGAGFQLTFQAVQPKTPASWEVMVMQNGKLVPGTAAAVRQGNTWQPISMVSWEPKDYTVDDLFSTNPFFIAHRGSGDTWPEHTMEAYNNATAYGVKALELSVQLTADNILICHHDLNFMKTAKDPRTVRSMTYAEILAEIKINTRQWTGLSSTLAPPPLAKDVIDAFIDTHVIFIEDKGGDGATALLNLMDTYPRGKDKFVWKQWAGAGQWAAAKERGYKLWGYFMADIFARIPELGPNFDYLGIPHTASDQVVSDIVAQGTAAGQPVIMWEIHYRWMFERAKALGVKGMMTSNIPYVFTTSGAQFTEDQWHTGVRPSGDLPQTTDGGWAVQPEIDAADGGVCRYVERGSGAMTLGSLCPVEHESYAVEWEMRFIDSLPADTTHAGIFTGHDEDRSHRTGSSSTVGGYHIIQRVNGQFDLMRHDPNSSAGIPLETTTAARPVLGQWMKFRVEMTPGSVTAKRLDGTPITLVSDDTLYRGGYLGVQKNFTTPAADPLQRFEYRSFKVTPIADIGPIFTPL